MPRYEGPEQSDLGLSDLCPRRGGAADGDGELEPRGESELGEDAGQVSLDGADRDGQPSRDVLVAGSGGHEADQLALARRELLAAGDGGHRGGDLLRQIVAGRKG